jgi:hypothetical protein
MIQNLKAIILGLIITLGASYVIAAWNEPTCSAPGCNTPSFVTASSTPQYKSGALSIGTTVLPTADYVLSVLGGNSFFDGLVISGLTIADGTQGNGKVYTYNGATQKGEWRNPPNTTGSTMTQQEFSINVLRNTTQSTIIPSTYQYCAISQMGPDFANSDNGDTTASVCSVNRNGNGTWTLYGKRLDDPDFICKARCFSISSTTAVYSITNFVPPPTSNSGLSTSGLPGTIIYLNN